MTCCRFPFCCDPVNAAAFCRYIISSWKPLCPSRVSICTLLLTSGCHIQIQLSQRSCVYWDQPQGRLRRGRGWRGGGCCRWGALDTRCWAATDLTWHPSRNQHHNATAVSPPVCSSFICSVCLLGSRFSFLLCLPISKILTSRSIFFFFLRSFYFLYWSAGCKASRFWRYSIRNQHLLNPRVYCSFHVIWRREKQGDKMKRWTFAFFGEILNRPHPLTSSNRKTVHF